VVLATVALAGYLLVAEAEADAIAWVGILIAAVAAATLFVTSAILRRERAGNDLAIACLTAARGRIYSYLADGGELNIPFLRRIIGVPLRVCISTSVVTVVGTSTVAALIRLPAAQIDWSIAIVGAVGILLGSQAGARLAAVIPMEFMRKAMVGLFIVLAALMLVQTIAA